MAGAADVVLLVTWSRASLPALAGTRAGQHRTSLGTDEPGKRELAADLRDAVLLVVDDPELAAQTGALAAPGLARTATDATLTDVLRGTHPGRTCPGQRTVSAPVGLSWQDLALAWHAFRQAERRGAGASGRRSACGAEPLGSGPLRHRPDRRRAAILIASRRGGVPK
ncbi:hypothetical protein ACFY71_12180 [Streptomyces cinerochromogenes]|uniref:hypothetical protein n=1 Tax=Streptomyces cinerochromogenes TaxID=66422 RepID=UPI0036748857